MVATFLAAIAVLIVLAVICGFQYVHWLEHRITDQMGQSAAESCSTVFDVMAMDDEGVPRYQEGEYEQWREILRSLCQECGMEYMYAYRCDPGNNTLTYSLFEDADLEEETVMLQQGEYLLLTTDGATETVNEGRSFLGVDGLLGALKAARPFGSAEALADAVMEAVDAFAGGYEQFDDVTVLALRMAEGQEGAQISPLRALPVDIASFSAIRDEVMAGSADRAFGLRADTRDGARGVVSQDQ